MAELMRCRSCGYVIGARKVPAACPACGAARKSMEAWKDPVQGNRRLLLSLGLHPIVDHFTVAFAAAALVLSLYVLAFPDLYRQTATGMLRGFVGVLPVAVLGSFLTGLVDARARFRRLATPALRGKMIVGGLFFVASTAAAVLLFVAGPYEAPVREACAVLLAACVVCAAVLGRAGSTISRAVLPD